jgi:membrane protease YdiL (CAAX protease family)
LAETDGGIPLTESSPARLRVEPTPAIGYCIAVGYAVLFTVLEKVIGVSYTQLGKTSGSVLHGIVIPLVIAGGVMAGLTTLLGWWRPVLREEPLGVKWMWAIPVVLMTTVLVGVDYSQLGAVGGSYLTWLALGTLLVGFNEELAYRGLALVAFRGTYKEVFVWLLTSAFFGLLHGVNIFLGQGVVATVRQVVFAFVLGSVLYVARRVTGSLLFLIAVHALWDFGSFTFVGGLAATGVPGASGVALARLPLLVALVVMCMLGANSLFAAPAHE